MYYFPFDNFLNDIENNMLWKKLTMKVKFVAVVLENEPLTQHAIFFWLLYQSMADLGEETLDFFFICYLESIYIWLTKQNNKYNNIIIALEKKIIYNTCINLE